MAELTRNDFYNGERVYKCKHCQDNGFIEVDREKNLYGFCICHPLVKNGKEKASNPYLKP